MNIEREILTILLVIGGIIAFLILIKLILNFLELKKQLNYINIEIARADKDYVEYWKKEKRKAWLRLLPFYRG